MGKNVKLNIMKEGKITINERSVQHYFHSLLVSGSSICLPSNCHAFLHLCHYWHASKFFIVYRYGSYQNGVNL